MNEKKWTDVEVAAFVDMNRKSWDKHTAALVLSCSAFFFFMGVALVLYAVPGCLK